MPKAIGDSLIEFLRPRPECPQIIHLLDVYKAGFSDRQWVEEVKKKGWLPITGDRGMSNRGEKLPKLLAEMGVVHISLSAAVNQLRVGDKAIAIASCWIQIVDVWARQIGCCHRLCLSADKKRFTLVDVSARRKPKS